MSGIVSSLKRNIVKLKFGLFLIIATIYVSGSFTVMQCFTFTFMFMFSR